MNARLDGRARVLDAFGASSGVKAELLSYDPGERSESAISSSIRFPLADETFVDTWREYSQRASAMGFPALAEQLVQLRFPVEEGISQTDEYRAVTRRGASADEMASTTGLRFVHPERCSVIIHPTWAGSIPIIQTSCREDFVSLVQAFTARNEPVFVPPSQGACIVAGYNNWDRVRRFRHRWMMEQPTVPFSLSFLSGHTDEYQDRFLLLGNGPYSGVPAERLGLSCSEWQDLSLTIRREHECAHYWTRRVFSSMKNRIVDELLADYCGLVGACGRLRADWLLTFLGIDNPPTCREDGRLHNYRGNPPLSDEAFEVLQRVTLAAVENLATFDRSAAAELSGRRGLLLILLTLSRMSLEDMAGGEAQTLLLTALRDGRTLASRAGQR